jgi:hypothetical protein
MDEEERSYARRHAAELADAVPCPRCGAAAYEPCSTRTGRTFYDGARLRYHAPRVEAFLASLWCLVLLVSLALPAVDLPS